MSERDFFREYFKYFKNKKSYPEFSEVVDFDAFPYSNKFSLLQNESKLPCTLCCELGLHDHNSWNISSLSGKNGFLFLRNPFTTDGQTLWTEKCLKIYPRKPSVTNLDSQSTLSERKLSWCTFGYHHNWETKVYDPNHRSPFPACLDKLSRHIASCLGFEDFVPEAAIVNYYSLKSSLGIHNDHSERNLDAPLLSISFGQRAVFLVGERDERPAALLLRSGDVVLMSGPSRLAYHAVPRILPGDVEECSSELRINVSVRQVY